jgi:Dipeptidyl aminopeptidases/acylaminoacyl-peptidases
MFVRLAQEHVPRFRFGGRGPEDFTTWKRDALPLVKNTLGELPGKVPPAPELQVEWTHDGLLKQRWIIDVSRHISAVVQINSPAGAAPGEKLPGILCWHGHFFGGKETVMGNSSSPELRAIIARHNCDYGHRMALEGFATFAIDWFGYGDRNDGDKPNWRSPPVNKDWCDVYYLHATMLGMTPLGIYAAHGMAAADFVCSLGRVDPERLGVMGLSGGGTMALWSALMDSRMKAAELICYSDLWAAFGYRDINYCGMEVAPGLFRLVDVPDLQGLLAPSPLLLDIGVHDTCYKADTAMECYRQVERIYRAAGASGRLELDLFDGEHAWGGNRSAAFFKKYLSGG